MLELHREGPDPKFHQLKCWPRFFTPLASGHLTYNVRHNDRDYKPGDFLQLNEWHPPSSDQLAGGYTGAYVIALVANVQDAADLTFGEGIADGGLVKSDTVVMGIQVLFRDLTAHQPAQNQAPPVLRPIQ